MAIRLKEDPCAFGLVMPNTPVKNIPDGFKFVRIQSSAKDHVLVILQCEVDGLEYPFFCKWEDESLKVESFTETPTLESIELERAKAELIKARMVTFESDWQPYEEPEEDHRIFYFYGGAVLGMVVTLLIAMVYALT